MATYDLPRHQGKIGTHQYHRGHRQDGHRELRVGGAPRDGGFRGVASREAASPGVSSGGPDEGLSAAQAEGDPGCGKRRLPKVLRAQEPCMYSELCFSGD